MSDDRIYLRCKKCGHVHLLFKITGPGGEIWRPNNLREWMTFHYLVCGIPDFDTITERHNPAEINAAIALRENPSFPEPNNPKLDMDVYYDPGYKGPRDK
jgi:hypothetical protein